MADGSASHGRSAQSPGHQKKLEGAQSARDFAPGHDEARGEGAIPESVDLESRGSLG